MPAHKMLAKEMYFLASFLLLLFDMCVQVWFAGFGQLGMKKIEGEH